MKRIYAHPAPGPEARLNLDWLAAGSVNEVTRI